MRGTLNGIVGLGRALAAAALMTAALQSVGSAQTPAPRPSQTQSGQSQTRGGADANADLSITARVTAESLRFEKVPNPRVEFTGRPERQTVWESDRENLPQEVRPGVTYRNIGITLRITSVFADIDRIVAEALGEVPTNEDARPATPQPPATSTTPPATNVPPPDSTSPAAQPTPPTQPDTPAAEARQRRRATARRGRGN